MLALTDYNDNVTQAYVKTGSVENMHLNACVQYLYQQLQKMPFTNSIKDNKDMIKAFVLLSVYVYLSVINVNFSLSFFICSDDGGVVYKVHRCIKNECQ